MCNKLLFYTAVLVFVVVTFIGAVYGEEVLQAVAEACGTFIASKIQLTAKVVFTSTLGKIFSSFKTQDQIPSPIFKRQNHIAFMNMKEEFSRHLESSRKRTMDIRYITEILFEELAVLKKDFYSVDDAEFKDYLKNFEDTSNHWNKLLDQTNSCSTKEDASYNVSVLALQPKVNQSIASYDKQFRIANKNLLIQYKDADDCFKSLRIQAEETVAKSLALSHKKEITKEEYEKITKAIQDGWDTKKIIKEYGWKVVVLYGGSSLFCGPFSGIPIIFAGLGIAYDGLRHVYQRTEIDKQRSENIAKIQSWLDITDYICKTEIGFIKRRIEMIPAITEKIQNVILRASSIPETGQEDFYIEYVHDLTLVMSAVNFDAKRLDDIYKLEQSIPMLERMIKNTE